MEVINVFSAKGGVGCTSTASAIALELVSKGKNVLLVGGEDVASILGVASISDECKVAHTDGKGELSYSRENHSGFDYVVNDLGKWIPSDGIMIMCVTNDYMTLKNSIAVLDKLRDKGHSVSIVGLFEENRALNMGDCQAVLREEDIFWVNRDPAVFRSQDAGLLTTRFNRFYTGISQFFATPQEAV